jgi:predicted nucleic acid-binding protein
MSPVAFIDANIPIYAAGRAHSYKEPCADILGLVAESPLSFVTDAEVLQELVHRYLAQDRWALGRHVLRNFALVMQDRIEPVHAGDILSGADLADRHPGISSRDLVHAAVMARLGVERIISADTDFDRLSGITRLDPMLIGEWGSSLQG